MAEWPRTNDKGCYSLRVWGLLVMVVDTKPNQTRQTANPMELIISVTSETLAKHKRREVMAKEYTIRGSDVEWIH